MLAELNKNFPETIGDSEQLQTNASNDAIFDVQEKTGGDILKITKFGGFTQVILATLEKIKDPAKKITDLQNIRASLCKINPENCANDDL